MLPFQIHVSEFSQESQLDLYKISRTLGKGSTAKVKLATHSLTNTNFALKIFRFDPSASSDYYRSLLLSEVTSLSQISHQNVVHLFDYKETAWYESKSKSHYKCMYLVLEYCPHGEIFYLLKKNGSLSEAVSLYYFRQLISTLESCNKSGYSHGDLKPENILIGDDLGLRLVDFGLSCKLENSNADLCGTDQYLPPEIRLKIQYDPVKADLFVAGVMLFIMFVGCPPFQQATEEDIFYRLIIGKKTGLFWMYFQKRRPEKRFSDEFKALVEGLLDSDPHSRFDYLQIRHNQWYQQQLNNSLVLRKIQDLIRT